MTDTGRAAEGTNDDVDFEADLDQAPRRLSEAEERAQLLADAERTPTVIVDNLHVTYRVFGGRKRASVAKPQGRLRRLLNRGSGTVGNVTEIRAVRGVSFVAHHGEAIGLVGRNGSGKSTLLRAIAGLLPLTAGSVYVAGEPALLGVNAALMNDLTGERNIMIGGLALGLSPGQVRERFDDIVDFAGIGDFVYLPMKAYSSGMAARLRFAISAAATPDVLMIDEALATGDAEFRARSQARIEEIRRQAGTVFLVSHSIAAVQSLCTRALWIDKGVLQMDGPAGEVCEAYKKSVYPNRPTSS